MNKVIIMGRLTREPNVTYSQGERPTAVARFTVAVDRPGARNSQDQNQPTADFISCVAFGQQGEFAEQYLHQGTKIVLEGRIQTGSYTNRDGHRVYTTDVVAERIEFAESKASSQQNHPNAADPDYTMQQGQEYYSQQVSSWAPVPPSQQAPQQTQSQRRGTNTSRTGTANTAQRPARSSQSRAAQPSNRQPQAAQPQEGFINMDNVPLDDEGLPF